MVYQLPQKESFQSLSASVKLIYDPIPKKNILDPPLYNSVCKIWLLYHLAMEVQCNRVKYPHVKEQSFISLPSQNSLVAISNLALSVVLVDNKKNSSPNMIGSGQQKKKTVPHAQMRGRH